MINNGDMRKLQELIDRGILADKLKHAPEWLLIQKIAAQIAKVSTHQLSRLGLEVAVKGEMTNELRQLIAKHQAKVELYGGFAQNIVESIYAEAKNAFELSDSLGYFDSNG